MTSVEFGKICRPLNREYKDIFGYVPCQADYICSQEEFIDGLKSAIEQKKELSVFVRKRANQDYSKKNIRYRSAWRR